MGDLADRRIRRIRIVGELIWGNQFKK